MSDEGIEMKKPDKWVRGIPFQQVIDDEYQPECCKWRSMTPETFDVLQLFEGFYGLSQRRGSLEEAVDDVVRSRKLRIANLARSIETYEGPEK